MADITLQQAQQMVDSWIKTYGVRYFNELTNMTILTEEVGELARIMARTYGEQSFKESDKLRSGWRGKAVPIRHLPFHRLNPGVCHFP